MSKTDKTRPWRVRAADSPMHTCVPVHLHEDGVCDLPENPVLDEISYFRADRCYWTYGPDFYYGRDKGCGCASCTGQVWRRRERRAHRHVAARLCRDAIAVHRAGGADEVADFDDHVPRRPQW